MADERCFAQANAVINSSTREQDNQVEHSKNRRKGIKNVGVSTPCYPPYGEKEPVFFICGVGCVFHPRLELHYLIKKVIHCGIIKKLNTLIKKVSESGLKMGQQPTIE
ncbi:Uncharacterized protein APZ42_024424 [Daphnia magna]|uniref:Uncharacterized protein n=1 Tax=Daphnia magna TaxID=35525 RepID=A0A164U1U1_9CRUS|nr:Uncharacterized protein APZ42_024424 [Daphnia magna]